MKKFDLIRYSFLGFSGLAVLAIALEFKIRRHISIFSWMVAGLVMVGFFVLLDMYLLEPNLPVVEKVVIQDGVIAERMKGLTVVHISDIHLRDKPGFLENRLASKINALQPDLLFITGDFLDDLGSLNDMVTLLKSFSVKVGIYGVLGNTDHHFFRTKGLMKELQSSGITILLNENRRVSLSNGKQIWLAGVDDPVGKRDKLSMALEGIPASEPVLLLAHSPDIYVQSILAKVNMVMVGHTHGGQIGIPFLIQRSDYANRSPFMSGLFRDGSTSMYVNRGIGTKTLPVRLLCRPEITCYEWR
jgi:predicted MPP superfamily phosphohydrolase